MPKLPTMLIMPAILTVFNIVLIAVPRVTSVSANIEGFRKFYGGFILLFSIFLLLIQYQMILWSLGIEINPLVVILAMVPIFIIWIAMYFCVARRKN